MLVASRGESATNRLCNALCLAFRLLACITNGVLSRLPVGVNMDGRHSVGISHGVFENGVCSANH